MLGACAVPARRAGQCPACSTSRTCRAGGPCALSPEPQACECGGGPNPPNAEATRAGAHTRGRGPPRARDHGPITPRPTLAATWRARPRPHRPPSLTARQLARETTALVRSYTLPDGCTIRLGAERFMAPEALFTPALVDCEAPGISEMVFGCIQVGPKPRVRAAQQQGFDHLCGACHRAKGLQRPALYWPTCKRGSSSQPAARARLQ